MPGNQRQLWVGQFTIDDMQVGSTDCARTDLDEHLACGGLADVFLAISNRTRRALLRRLAEDGEQPVNELLKPFSISQAAVSKHLRCLRRAGLVRRRSQGRRRFYRLDAGRLRQVYDWVSYFEEYWDEKLDALGHYLDKRKRTKPTPD